MDLFANICQVAIISDIIDILSIEYTQLSIEYIL